MERSVDLVISLSHNNKSKEKGNKELEFQKRKMIVPDASSLTLGNLSLMLLEMQIKLSQISTILILVHHDDWHFPLAT